MPAKPGTAKTTKKTTNGNAPQNGETARRPAQSATSSTDVNEQIQQRAYQLYLQRGRRDGFHEQDWLQAEAEVRSGLKSRSA